MTFYDCTYVIVAVGDVTQPMVDQCVQDTVASLRMNNAETHVILKWFAREDDPALIVALDPDPTQYTRIEMITFLVNAENGWVPDYS